ncbi:ABC transporter ATP-binding protein [Humidisolicoccus flavus]|uniref:ABC transporter ATP-binding protein n=1 Tax=Humidisolicoccus flavus TaxID=3111414 RepID=UPI00324BBC46
MAALMVRGLTREYAGGGGIRDISFAAEDRAVTAVIGPNGAGKTVLFTLIAGLARPQAGSISFANERPRVAYCPDVPQFEPWLTALEVVTTSLSLAPPAARMKVANTLPMAPEAALEACGLRAVMHRRVADFSRGMLQRLGIAAALVNEPEILILDEPSSALDPIGRAEIREIIRTQKNRRCILLSSHLLSEVEQLADSIVVLDQGRVVASGTPDSILIQGLEPTWVIRFGAPPLVDAATISASFPGVKLESSSPTLWSAGFESFQDAERHLSALLSACNAPLLEVTLRDRDLDASFARLVSKVGAS